MDEMITPLDAAMRVLGHGEPERAVWFVGLEYADAYASAAEALEFYSTHGDVARPTCPPDFSPLGAKGRSLRHLTARVLKWTSRSGAAQDHEWFLQNRLWWPGSETFQANLYPLGKPNHSTEIPDVYHREFGVTDWDSYRRRVIEQRLPLLQRLWADSARKAVVCFGSGERDLFRMVFDITSDPETIVPGKVEAYRRERVVFTPFLDFRFVSYEDADRIGVYLRDALNVEIP